MKGKLISSEDILELVDHLRLEYEVVAPFKGRGRDTFFEVVTDDNLDQVQMHLANPNYPPKRFLLPQIQRLFKIQLGTELQFQPVIEGKKRAIFGIRSCDLKGIFHLDRFYLGGTHKDNYYEAFRRDIFLVNVVCSDPELDISDDCFCVCADAGPAGKDLFDLQLMDLNDGNFLAVAGSEKGEALFTLPIFKKAGSSDLEKRKKILTDVRKRFKTATSWYSAATRLITQGQVSDKTWKEIGDRCLECGGCSYVCPACTCFTVAERKTGENEVERVRMWDACALSGFTRMAGGHNPRKATHDRRNRRFFRKLAHYFIQREFSVACVGCGRCVTVCHGDVGMPTVVEMIRRESQSGGKKDAFH